MPEYLLLMHGDATGRERQDDWTGYIDGLGKAGALRGGSAIGEGFCARQAGVVPPVSGHLVGYVKIEARDLDHARELLRGNPVYEAGGTVEIRHLPRTG